MNEWKTNKKHETFTQLKIQFQNILKLMINGYIVLNTPKQYGSILITQILI